MIAANFGFTTGLTSSERQVATDFSDMAGHNDQTCTFSYWFVFSELQVKMQFGHTNSKSGWLVNPRHGPPPNR